MSMHPSAQYSMPTHPVSNEARAIAEQAKHARMIEGLADEFSRSITEITPLYEECLDHLREEAVINDFLPILASKRVKRLFMTR